MTKAGSPSHRLGFDDTHDLFRASVRAFLEREVVPNDAKWNLEGKVDRQLFSLAGKAGLLGLDAPETFGGGAASDFRYNAIIGEEAARLLVSSSVSGIVLQNDVCLPYILCSATEEQKQRWLPGICDGSTIIAIAMSEPSMGSDLLAMQTTARRDGDSYIVNGSKTFISSGQNCDLLILACRTESTNRREGISLLVVEAERTGFHRGRNLNKIGQHSADTSELFFSEMQVPLRNLLGSEGSGFQLMVDRLPRERLSIAVSAVAQAEAAFQLGLNYAKDRQAFGQPIGRFQHNKFVLAEMKTEIDVARTFVDHQIDALNRGELTPDSAAEAKWWCTELCNRVVDRSLQLHGGYGYMEEYPISRLWRDARVATIYGGTTEIMKEVVGRSLGL